MASVYRLRFLKSGLEATNTQSVHIDAFVERRSGLNPNFTWTLIQGGHATVDVPQAMIAPIENGAGDPAAKKLALIEVIKQIIGVDALIQSDLALITIQKYWPDDENIISIIA